MKGRTSAMPSEDDAYYELHLPVFKQGDDLAHHLANEETVADAFEALAGQYDAAAALCRRMAGLAREAPGLEVHADTHHIGVHGPVERLDALVVEGVLQREEDDPDDDDLDGVEDEEDEEDPEDVFADGLLDQFAGQDPFTAEDAVARFSADTGLGLDVEVAQRVIAELVEDGDLRRLDDGRYEVVLEDEDED